MSNDKQETTQKSGAFDVPIKQGKRSSCADHCKRFWWLHLIIFICFTVLIICLVIFVGVPHVAQHKVNLARLEIQGVSLLQTEPDSFTLSINSTVTTDGSVRAKIYGFTGNLYLEDLPEHAPFATLDFPDTSSDKHQEIKITQNLRISDSKAFTTFNTWFFKNDTLRITLEGHTQVKPKSLNKKFGVTFKKTVTIKGLNRFAGAKVLNGRISTDQNVPSNFNGAASIPNQSAFTLDIGNATFRTFIQDDDVGILNITNFVLHPGDNTVDIMANLDQVAIVTDLSSPTYCKTGVIPFRLLGDEVTNHGKHIPYFEAALSSANQTVNMDLGAIVKQDLNITVGCSS